VFQLRRLKVSLLKQICRLRLGLAGDDVRRQPFTEHKAILRKVLQRTRRGIQYVEHADDDGGENVSRWVITSDSFRALA